MSRGWEIVTVGIITNKKFGKFAFVDTEDGVSAFLPLSMVPDKLKPLELGQKLEVKITLQAKKGPKVLKINEYRSVNTLQNA